MDKIKVGIIGSGFIADHFGRKLSITIGLILLGVSFEILGFAISNSTVLIYLTASGVAWGFFFAIYLTIPGDLSICGSREKFYSLIAVLPLILLTSVPFLPGLADLTQYSSSFSHILGLILFISIIPVIGANETLPKGKIRERKMKEYLNQVGKVISESEQKKQE